MTRPKSKRPSKKTKLKWNAKAHGRDAHADGFHNSPSHRIEAAKKMADYDQQAKDRGVPVAQVIAEDIACG